MNINRIFEIAKHEFQQKLTEFCQNRDFTKLTPENAEQFAKGLRKGLSAAGAAAYKAFIESHDESNKAFWFLRIDTVGELQLNESFI